MTKWKKDAKEFEVVMNDDNRGSRYCRIPKPIDELLDSPDKIKFIVQGSQILVIGD